MSRFGAFTPRERIVMKQALQELAEQDDDPATGPWCDAANDLFFEVDKDCGREEQIEAEKLNKEGEERE